MGLVDELAKLQQLKLDGVLTEDEFAQAKQKLLEEDTSEIAPSPAQTINLSLKDGIDEVVNEESTLGGAANRYVDYKKTEMIVGAVVFIVVVIIFAIIFSNFSHGIDRGLNSFPRSMP